MWLQAVTLDLHNSVHLADIHTSITHVVLYKGGILSNGQEMKYPKCVLPYEKTIHPPCICSYLLFHHTAVVHALAAGSYFCISN